jgi:hypothetical protein
MKKEQGRTPDAETWFDWLTDQHFAYGGTNP